jgi:uncharacterized protein (TIGR02246 family)
MNDWKEEIPAGESEELERLAARLRAFRLTRDEMTIEQELMSIERTLWTTDAAIYEATYLPDAVLIFPVVGKIGRASAVAAIREENAANRRWAEVNFAGVSVLLVAPDVALLSYEATARWNYEEVATKALCATVYVKRNGAWRVALHQQTPV